MHQPTNQAYTEADEGNDHKHQDQRVASNCTNERPNPSNGAGNERGHIGQQSSNGNSFRENTS